MTDVKAANWFDLVIRIAGITLYLTCLPMDLLNGNGKGFLADSDHFQGYEFLLLLPLYFTSEFVVHGPWIAAFYFGCIGLSNCTVSVGPLFPSDRIPIGVAIAVGLATLISAGFFTLWTMELGLMPGYLVWMAAAACGMTWIIRGQVRRLRQK